jgi:hypothetical protein
MSIDFELTQLFKHSMFKRNNYYVILQYVDDGYSKIPLRDWKIKINAMTPSIYLSYNPDLRLKKHRFLNLQPDEIFVFCQTVGETKKFLKKYLSIFLRYPYRVQIVDELWKF